MNTVVNGIFLEIFVLFAQEIPRQLSIYLKWNRTVTQLIIRIKH